MSRTLRQLTKAIGLLVLPAVVALGYLTSFSQGIPPQSPCGNLPGQEHQCSTGLGGCDTHRICEEEGNLGVVWQTKCCYHDVQGKCVQVRGGWECCALDPPSWKAICEEQYRDVNKVCFGDTHCLDP